MKKVISMVLLALFLVGMTAAAVGPASAQGPMGREASEHPNIVRAIDALQDAIADLQAAPHDFGGHKAQAIEASQRAIRQLKMALAYRAHEDRLR
jgi:TolA-binding protein